MRCPAFDNKSWRQGCWEFCCYVWNRESWEAHKEVVQREREERAAWIRIRKRIGRVYINGKEI